MVPDYMTMAQQMLDLLSPIVGVLVTVMVITTVLRVVLGAARVALDDRGPGPEVTEKEKTQRAWIEGPAELPEGEFSLGADGELMFHKSEGGRDV